MTLYDTWCYDQWLMDSYFDYNLKCYSNCIDDRKLLNIDWNELNPEEVNIKYIYIYVNILFLTVSNLKNAYKFTISLTIILGLSNC